MQIDTKEESKRLPFFYVCRQCLHIIQADEPCWKQFCKTCKITTNNFLLYGQNRAYLEDYIRKWKAKQLPQKEYDRKVVNRTAVPVYGGVKQVGLNELPRFLEATK